MFDKYKPFNLKFIQKASPNQKNYEFLDFQATFLINFFDWSIFLIKK